MWRSGGSVHRQVRATCVDQIIVFGCGWYNGASIIAINPWKNWHASVGSRYFLWISGLGGCLPGKDADSLIRTVFGHFLWVREQTSLYQRTVHLSRSISPNIDG